MFWRGKKIMLYFLLLTSLVEIFHVLLLSVLVYCGYWKASEGFSGRCTVSGENLNKQWVNKHSLLYLWVKCIHLKCTVKGNHAENKVLSSFNVVFHRCFKILAWCILLWSSFCFSEIGQIPVFLKGNRLEKSGNMVRWVLCQQTVLLWGSSRLLWGRTSCSFLRFWAICYTGMEVTNIHTQARAQTVTKISFLGLSWDVWQRWI